MALDIVGPANAANSVTVRPSDTRTFGASDTWFKDCTSPSAADGTQIKQGWLNGMVAQVRGLIRGNGLTAGSADIVTLDNADDSMMFKAVQHAIQRGQPRQADDSSVSANTITVALSPAAAEYKHGMCILVKIKTTNTGATNLNLNSLGNKAVLTMTGTTMVAGALLANSWMEFVYDSAANAGAGAFIATSPLGPAAFSLPKCTVTTAAIGSLSFGVATLHGMSVASHNDMGVSGPTISGGNSVVLPAGTYAFQIKSQVTINNVVTATQIAGHTLLVKNGAEVQRATEATYLLTGQNVTVFPGFAGTVSVNGTDTLGVQEIGGATDAGHYSGGSSGAGQITFQRIGA